MIIVALTASATGTIKLNPFVIAKVKRPRHVQIIQTPTTTVEDIDDRYDMALSQLRDLIRSLPTQAEMSAKEYIRVDDIQETGQQLNDDDILTLASGNKVPIMLMKNIRLFGKLVNPDIFTAKVSRLTRLLCISLLYGCFDLCVI
ncbi:hypothetical protein CHS0354_008866 [Potamilus streckersoni]|uniref:Uncharacterized protein n=1 Tax=Potamilus streckersoni TaxID=2493646 RepID=A0AAE0RUE8_9BIVA|nr:hypothetical protein CHS0354_008866 [Potamilus streckersoni]